MPRGFDNHQSKDFFRNIVQNAEQLNDGSFLQEMDNKSNLNKSYAYSSNTGASSMKKQKRDRFAQSHFEVAGQ